MTNIEKLIPEVKKRGGISALEIQNFLPTTSPHKYIQILQARGIIEKGGERRLSANGKKYIYHKVKDHNYNRD